MESKAKDRECTCVNLAQMCVDIRRICIESAQGITYNAKILSYRITFADLVAVGRVDRRRLRNLLKSLPEFAKRPANERIASEYTRHGLIVVAILCEQERMGLRKEAIAKWVSPIQDVLLGPRSMTVPQLFLSYDPAEASLADDDWRLSAGVVDLNKILTLVDSHCTGLDSARERRRELEFGHTSVGLSKSAAGQPIAHSHG